MGHRAGKKERGYHHGNLRHVLLAAALEILDVHGPDAVTIRAVARDAGVAHSAPANHFKDRTALLTQLAVGVFSDLSREIEAKCANCRAAKSDQLHAFAEAVLRYAWQYPNRYRLLWRADSIDSDHPDFQTAGGAIYERLRQIIASSKKTAPVSPDTCVVAAWSLVRGYISLRLDGALIAGTDETTGEPRERAIIEALISGIGR